MEQKFLYKSPNHLVNLNEIRLAEKLCDVIIKVDDRKIRAHKLILAAKLKYFDTMFLSSFQESKKDVITMEGVEGANLEALITFAYTGEILLTDSNALDLLAVADYLGEDGIKEACVEFLEKHLKKEDACRAYKFANPIDCLTLKTLAKKMIVSNVNSCLLMADYLDFNVENLKDILSNASSDFADAQHTYFESVMRWIVHDARHRKIHVNELLSLIDMTKLHTVFLLEYFCKNIGDQDYGEVTKDVMSYYRERNQLKKSNTKYRADKSDKELKRNLEINSIQLMIVGGIDKKLHFQLYDPAKKEWSDPLEVTHPDKNMDGHRWNCGAILENKFYYTFLNLRSKFLQAFDPVTKQSTTISSESFLLRYAAICSGNNCIYLCGGLNDDKTVSNQILKYDPRKNLFETLTPMGRKRSSAAAIYHQGRLYVLGGKDDKMQVLSVVEQYSMETDTWTELPSMSQPRTLMEVKVLNNKMYACGGWPRSVVEVYDLSTKEWHLVTNMKDWRSNFLVLLQLDGLLAIGGNNKNTAEEYNPSKDEWELVSGITSGLKIRYGTGGWVSVVRCAPDETSQSQ